jgi:hypothetical protein
MYIFSNRPTDGRTDGQYTDRRAFRQIDRQTRWTYRRTGRHPEGQTYQRADRQMDIQTDRQADRWAGRQMDIQTEKQADR